MLPLVDSGEILVLIRAADSRPAVGLVENKVLSKGGDENAQ
jgi:hypothetical protein